MIKSALPLFNIFALTFFILAAPRDAFSQIKKGRTTASATATVAEKKASEKPKSDAKKEADAQNLSKEMLNEINLLRANPQAYVKFLNERKDLYEDKSLMIEKGVFIETNEGVAAVDDAVKTLAAAKPLKPLILSAELTRAAGDHLKDMLQNSFFSHKGSDGSTPDARVEKYLNIERSEIRENLALSRETARSIVLSWLIDDGSARRGNRQSLLSPTLKFIGIAAGKNGDEMNVIVATFSSDNRK